MYLRISNMEVSTYTRSMYSTFIYIYIISQIVSVKEKCTEEVNYYSHNIITYLYLGTGSDA
jgi:hypothetical protein